MSMKEYLEIFTRHVEKLAETDHYGDDGYTREFQTLKQRSAQYKINGTYLTEEGEKEWNKRKNRFKDILPYDHTRVKLVAVPGVSGSDYINANFLKGPNGQHMYIASQGPLLHTKVDFWRMVWEYDVNVVVMACNEYEGEKLKCARYWPQVGKSEKYGKINVRFETEEKENQNFCIRHLIAEYGGVTRTVWQFHYGGWPDHGTPDIPSVLEMISVMRERQSSPLPPIVVHCSAGCGRTGTICAIDYAWHVLKLGLLTADFSLFDIIDEMRTQRNAIVQTKDQYVSVHHAVRDLFSRHLEVINEHNYENLAVNGQVPASGTEYESVAYDESQYLEPSKTKPTTLTPPNQESPTERAIYSTVANLINANQIGTGNGGAPPSPPETPPDPHYVAITMKDYKAYASDDEVLQSKDSGEEEHSPPLCLPHYATSHRPTNRNLEGNTLEAPAPPPRSSSIRRTVSDEPIANHLKPDSNLELGDSSNSQESGGTPGTKETLGLLTDYMGQNSDGWSSSAAGSQDGGEVLCDDKPDLLPDLPPPPPRPACMVKPTDRSSTTNTQNVNHYYNIADLQTNQVSSMDEVASSSPTDGGSSTDLLLEPPPLPPKLSDNESDEPDGYQVNTVIRGGAGGGSRAYPSGPPKPPHSSDAERCKSSPIHVSSPVHSSSSVHTSSPGLSSSPLHTYDLPEQRQSPATQSYHQDDPRNSPRHAHNQQWMQMQDAQMAHKAERDNRASPMYEVLSKFRSGPSVDHPPRQMNRSMDDADDESEEDVPQVPTRLYKTMPHPGKQQRRRRQQQLQLLLQQQQQEQGYAQRQESPYHLGTDIDKSSPGVVMIRNPAFSASMTQAELSPRLSPSRASEHPMPLLQNQLNDINKPGLPQKMHGHQDSRFQTYVKHEGPIEKRLSNIQLDDPIYGFHGQPQKQYQQQPKNNVSYAEGHYKVPSNHYPRDYNRQYSGSPTRSEMAHDQQNLCHHHKAQQQHVNQGDMSRLPSTGDPDMEFAYNKDDGDYVSLRVKQQQQQQLLQRQQQQIAFQQNLEKQAGGSAQDEGAYGYAYVGGGGKPSVVVPQGPAPVKPPRRKRRPHSVSAADMSERMEREAMRQRASVRMEESCEGALGIPVTYQPVEGAIGANNRMTRSSYGSTSDDSLQGPDIPYKTPEAYFPAHQAGIDDHQVTSQDETSAADSMTSSVIQFGKKIKRVVMGQSLSTSNHSDIKPVPAKDIYFKGKLINFPHRVDRPRRPPVESPYEVPRSTQVHRK